MKKTRYAYMLMILSVGIWALSAGIEQAWSENHNHENHEKHENHKEDADHDDEDDHAEHDGHDEHDEPEEAGLRLTSAQRKHFGIVIKKASSGSLSSKLRLPGEVVFNEDRVVHIVPRVSGIVRKVNKTIGDSVVAGEVMAVIDSRELADAKAKYLADVARLGLAEAKFKRENILFNKKVSSKDDFLDAEQAATEARINKQTSEQKLQVLGYSDKEVTILSSERDKTITRYELKAPFAGVVTEKHVSLGESLEGNAEIFTVADLSVVWVNLTVYTKDLEAVHKGQGVKLVVDHSGVQTQGKVSMITPFLDETTRSATARVVVDNLDGRWRPGTFVTGNISLSENDVSLVVPLGALQVIEDNNVIFIEHEGAFEMVPVQIGRSDRTHVEILSGLEPGSTYVSEGAFGLKATVVTSNLGSHAGHGH